MLKECQMFAKKILFLAILFHCCSEALACPPGHQPAGSPTSGNPSGCVPYASGDTSQPQTPQGRWITRWGAIAIGSTASGGGVGISKDMPSKRQAGKVALLQCEATGGGSECKINILHYYNQCAVIAWGDSFSNVQSAETIQIASSVAMQKCSAKTDNCKIYYSDCSLPEWVQ